MSRPISGKRLYNLDGLRAVAAISVAIVHFEGFKHTIGLPAAHNRFFENSSQLAVSFFFVLSGFLISWWLLEEKRRNGKINVLNFYKRRVSRTWPLYYLIVFFAAILSCMQLYPLHTGNPKNLILYALFMPNNANAYFGPNMFINQSWSLAVEELFYLLFPLIFLTRKFKSLLWLLGAVFIIWGIVSAFITPKVFSFWHFRQGPAFEIAFAFFDRYRFYCFAAGAIAACCIFLNKKKAITSERSGPQRGSVIYSFGIVLLFLFGITFSILTQQAYAILFALLLYFLVIQNRPFLLLNNGFMQLAGKASYSIYMLHMFICIPGCYLLKNTGWYKYPFINFLSDFIYLAMVIGLSVAVFKKFEDPVRKLALKMF